MKQAKSWPKFKRKKHKHSRETISLAKQTDYMWWWRFHEAIQSNGLTDSLCMVTVSRIERNRAEQSKEESYYFFLIALQLSTFNISISDVRICEKFDFDRISNCTVYPNVYKSLCTESESCCFLYAFYPPSIVSHKKKKTNCPSQTSRKLIKPWTVIVRPNSVGLLCAYAKCGLQQPVIDE